MSERNWIDGVFEILGMGLDLVQRERAVGNLTAEQEESLDRARTWLMMRASESTAAAKAKQPTSYVNAVVDGRVVRQRKKFKR